MYGKLCNKSNYLIICLQYDKKGQDYVLNVFVLLKVFAQDTAYHEVTKILTATPISGAKVGKSIPYASIEIIDERFDTSKLGYTSQKAPYPVQKIRNIFSDPYIKIVTETSLKEVIQWFLNNSYENFLDKKSDQKLLIVIKKLWMVETFSEEMENNRMVQTMKPENDVALIHTSFELYSIKNDLYSPLVRIDSTFKSDDKLNKHVNELLAKPFHNALVKLAGINLEKVMTSRKALSWNDIVEFNRKRFAYPRFKSDLVTKGIYFSFKDFLDNNPVQKQFDIQFDELSDEIMIDENGSQNVLEKYWGVCDGEKTFIKLGANLFELTRVGNTYETRGSRTILKAHGTPTFNALSREMVKSRLVLKPLQLDMDTGKLH